MRVCVALWVPPFLLPGSVREREEGQGEREREIGWSNMVGQDRARARLGKGFQGSERRNILYNRAARHRTQRTKRGLPPGQVVSGACECVGEGEGDFACAVLRGEESVGGGGGNDVPRTEPVWCSQDTSTPCTSSKRRWRTALSRGGTCGDGLGGGALARGRGRALALGGLGLERRPPPLPRSRLLPAGGPPSLLASGAAPTAGAGTK